MFHLGRKPRPKPKRPPAAAASPGASPSAPSSNPALNAKRVREANRSRQKSASSREIGPLPAVADPARRDACAADLERFCLTYLAAIFSRPFCPDHKRVIAKLQRAILHGGLFALAMPRGFGKSSLVRGATLWALLYGHRRFPFLIAATAKKGKELLEGLKKTLRTNALILADFPEVAFPIVALENDGRRANGQTLGGVKTEITWGKDLLILPTVAGSKASGSIVAVSGLGGAMRGSTHTLATGEIIRPDLVIPDDPQTRESAWSESQCQTRYEILQGDVLGMAGTGGKPIACVMPCTIIRKGDLADRILDRKQNPEWQGEHCKMIYQFPPDPAAEKRWEEYWQIRADALRAGRSADAANDYLQEHFEAMHAGAAVAWEQGFDQGELSALQHAYNRKFRDEASFQAECQNEPLEAKAEVVQLAPEQIVERLSHVPRGLVPARAEKLTAFVDVHDELLYWMVCGWSIEEFDGWVVDYGVWPEQTKSYFTKRQAVPTLAGEFPGVAKEAYIRRGLDRLTAMLLSREFRRAGDGGEAVPLDKILIDQGYVKSTVHGHIRAAGRGSLILPAKGVGIGAGNVPMSEYRRKPGELLGTNWVIGRTPDDELRHVKHDTNSWKTFVQARLALPAGSKGALLLFGDKAFAHRMLADHLAGESGKPTEGNGRQLIEWKRKPNAEVHLLDCLVGCAVAASVAGCGKSMGPPPKKKRRASHRAPVYLA